MARGRPRKQGKRTKGGRLKVPFEDGPMQTVLQARRRHRRPPEAPTDAQTDALAEKQSITPQQARAALSAQTLAADKKPVTKIAAKTLRRLGSFLNELNAAEKITDEELAAGNDHAARYMRYAALNGLPFPHAQGSSYGEVRGGSRPDRLKAAKAAKDEYRIDEDILRHCSAGVPWAIKRACIRDEPAPVHLVQEGLRELVRKGR